MVIDQAVLMRMADWFQKAAIGAVLYRHSPCTPREWERARATGPDHLITKRVESWDRHDRIHGPLFTVKTTVRASHTAALCAKPSFDFLTALKSEGFDVHTVRCAHEILYSIGGFATEQTIEPCPTCSIPRVVQKACPETGSGFIERVGRVPDFDNDAWRLMYRGDRLCRFIRENEREGYWLSEFRLIIDSAGGMKGEGGRPYYWRLDPRSWWLK